jgi:hypothetical protein
MGDATISDEAKPISQGLKPAFEMIQDVRAKARTYLRGKGNSRFPSGITTKGILEEANGC